MRRRAARTLVRPPFRWVREGGEGSRLAVSSAGPWNSKKLCPTYVWRGEESAALSTRLDFRSCPSSLDVDVSRENLTSLPITSSPLGTIAIVVAHHVGRIQDGRRGRRAVAQGHGSLGAALLQQVGYTCMHPASRQTDLNVMIRTMETTFANVVSSSATTITVCTPSCERLVCAAAQAPY